MLASGERPTATEGSPAPAAAPSSLPASSSGRPYGGWLVVFALAALALVAVPLIVARMVDQPVGQEYLVEIPAGTAERLAAGEDVDVLPADLRLGLADTLVVVNLDSRPHQIGPFPVAPGQRFERRFADAMTTSGFCTLHASGTIDIEVRPG